MTSTANTDTTTQIPQLDDETRRDDEAQIRDLITQKEAAMRDHDAERIVSRYASDVVVFDLAPPLRKAGAEVTDPTGVREWFSRYEGPVHYRVRDLDVTIGGDVAYGHSLNRMSDVPEGESGMFELWFRSTVCLRRVDGSWKITHEHDSTPFLMDGSFRAAVDLQP